MDTASRLTFRPVLADRDALKIRDVVVERVMVSVVDLMPGRNRTVVEDPYCSVETVEWPEEVCTVRWAR
jgi:hypothetical protein